jgi:hypothetical protein
LKTIADITKYITFPNESDAICDPWVFIHW